MKTFTVHEPPTTPPDRLERAEGLVFVREGFTWMAALFAPLWMIVNRLWLVLLGYVVLVAAFQVGQKALGLDEATASLLTLGMNILIGFEADTLRRWTLSRRGWLNLGTVSGRSAEECERRFFDNWLPAQPLFAARDESASRRRWPVIGSLLGARA